MKTRLFVLLFTSVLLTSLAAQADRLTADQALISATKALLPQGTDEVVLKIWGPISAGTPIRATKGLALIAPTDGYALYIDDYPTANLFHPVRYAFINGETGQVTAVNANSPPENYQDYRMIETVIGQTLMAAVNRRASQTGWGLPIPPTRGDRWAVLMNGGYNQGNNHVRYWNDLSNIYITLSETYGYADDHIIVLCSDGTNPAPDQSNGQNSNPDLDGDGDPDIMYPCVLNSVNQVFAYLATVLSADDHLFIFTTDHGDTQGGWNTIQNLWNQEILTDAHFAELLDALPDLLITCTLEPCFSGGFLDNVVVPPGPRIASSSCAYNEYSWAMPPDYVYDTYVFHWTAAVKGEDAYGVQVDADYNSDGVVTMDEAYRYAEAHDQSDESPQYGEQPAGLGATVSLWPLAAALAPAAPSNFIVSNNQAQLLASLSWTNPTLTFNGQPLITINSIMIKRNGALVDSLDGNPGQVMTYNNSVPAAASYYYQIYAVNDAGSGVPANATAWIGLDNPGPVTALTGSGVGTTLVANLSWTNPSVGQHGGYFTTSTITGYIINRYGPSSATFNLSGLQTTYTDNSIPVQGWYHYGVVPQNASGSGPETMTGNFYVGPPEMVTIPYNWVEISHVGTNTGLTGDDQNLGPFPIGFTFNHYGNNYNQVRVCSNGWISFTSTSTAYSNTTIPATAEPNNMLAPLWDDLYPPGPPVGIVYYYYDAANSRFIVEWDNVMSYTTPRTPQKFEVILNANGDVDFMYHTIQAPCTNANTAGKENATGTVGVLATFNGSGPLEPASGTGIRIFGLPPVIPNVTITMTPVSPPIIIPAIGGSFDFNVSLVNGETTPQTFGAWIMVQLPGGSWYGPLLGPINLTLSGGATLTRLRTQNVPASAPAGQYLYEGRIGTYPGMVWDNSSFNFTKSAAGDGIPVGNWDNSGESFDPWMANTEPAPASFTLLSVFPNPFNPATVFHLSLPQAGFVNLAIYDIAGRTVARVINGWRDAGTHEVMFDGSNLPSGVYIYRLSAGGSETNGKLLLLK